MNGGMRHRFSSAIPARMPDLFSDLIIQYQCISHLYRIYIPYQLISLMFFKLVCIAETRS